MQRKNDKNSFKKFDASNWRAGIVAARFNQDITEALALSARNLLKEYFLKENNIDLIWVAGSVEIPLLLKTLAKTKKYDCLVAIGAIIRGETPHFEYVAKAVTEGVMRVMLDYEIPIGFGVLTCENLKQTRDRINVGANAAEAAIQSAKIIRNFENI